MCDSVIPKKFIQARENNCFENERHLLMHVPSFNLNSLGTVRNHGYTPHLKNEHVASSYPLKRKLHGE